jgi:hypothetical protein
MRNLVLGLALVAVGCTPAATPLTCYPECSQGFTCVNGSCMFVGGSDLAANSDGGIGCDPACSGLTPHCNAKGHCVGCTSDDQCPPGDVCKISNDAVANCVPGCASDDHCGGKKCCSQQCVDVQTDSDNCGGCGMPCAPAHARAQCAAGQCTTGACDPGWGDCNGKPADGCETNLHVDAANCAGCGMACSLANAVNGCSDGCYIEACNFGYDDCNMDPMDGCETQVLNDTANCGGCAVPCNGLPNAKATCTDGNCVLGQCNVGYSDCDQQPQNGCEVATGTDANNCGSCGNKCGNGLVCINGGCTCAKCNFPNAASSCVNNTCVMGACVQGFADCNNSPNDGCEVNLGTDPKNCGACNAPCANNLTCFNAMCTNQVCTPVNAPVFNMNISGWAMSGIQFHALKNGTLQSFTFVNQQKNNQNTIQLIDATAGNQQVGTINVPNNTPMFNAMVNWPLVQGHTYHLINVQDDGMWISYNQFPQANTVISVDGTWGNGALQTAYWFSYTNIVACG